MLQPQFAALALVLGLAQGPLPSPSFASPGVISLQRVTLTSLRLDAAAPLVAWNSAPQCAT